MKRIVITLGAGMLALLPAAAAQARTPQEERNLHLALEFYDAAMNQKDWEKAETYMGDRYIQHSIYMEDGHDGLEDLVMRVRRDYPDNRGEVKRAFVDGDMVFIQYHVKRTAEHAGWSVFEIMRLEDEKVIEHWDIFQALPSLDSAETMF